MLQCNKFANFCMKFHPHEGVFQHHTSYRTHATLVAAIDMFACQALKEFKLHRHTTAHIRMQHAHAISRTFFCHHAPKKLTQMNPSVDVIFFIHFYTTA